jgi:hypothetical protein
MLTMTRTRSLHIWILSPLLTSCRAHAGTGLSAIKKRFDLLCSPQRGAYPVTKFLLVFFLLSSPCFGQAWSNILSPSRAIDWTQAGLPATLPDGETTANPWTPPTRTQSGSTVNPSGNAATDLSNINAAMSSCTNGHYVLLGSGTFVIQGTLILYGNECTLRGSGGTATILSLSGSAQIWMGSASGGGSCTLASGSNFAAGSTSVTCNGLSGSAPAVGDIGRLSQCDTGYTAGTVSGGTLVCSTGISADNGGLFVCGYNTSCMTEPAQIALNASQQQNFYISSVSGSGTYTIGVNTPIYMPNWAFAKHPVLTWNNPANNGIGVGLEDLTIYSATSVTANYSIYMANTFASWVKGVRFIGSAVADPLAIQDSKNGLIFNNYCMAVPAVGSNYLGCLHSDTSSDTLILNNIWTAGNYEADGGLVGEVDAYNYNNWFFTEYLLSTVYDHKAYDSFRLEEGNQMGAIYADDTWGAHGLYTFFRNYLPCYDAPYTTDQDPSQVSFSIAQFQRFHNAIGNAAGSSQCTSYQSNSSSSAGYIWRIETSDPLTQASFMRWGNVSTVTQSSDTPANSGIRFVSSEVPNSTNMPSGTYPNAAAWQNSTPSNDNIPCSFFLPAYTSTAACSIKPSGGTGLSWWKVCKTWTTFPTSCAITQTQPFPIAGPDQSGGPYVNGYAYDNPASIAWQYLPIDATYQNSYTITGSSWSGGVETLTVSGLPAGSVHIEGPFQPSGLNSACTSGATFGSNSEIQITGSTSTTVQYALASNPGVSCGGTMKFPDVRQFDERVYMADGSGVGDPPPPNPPTNMTATVQ